MRRLVMFNQITLDGYFAGENGDLSWAHQDPLDAEWNGFVAENAAGEGPLVFGRITYQLMASYWPTPLAGRNDPVVAERMNHRPKLVFSRTLDRVSWNNSRLLSGDPAAEIRRLKQESGDDLAILGSGSIVAQLAPRGLIDEYQVVLVPLVLGRGQILFDRLPERLSLKRTAIRTFDNGKVLLRYQPAG